ncbi:putative membrane protein [Natronobacillus azotifigens]|uniref:PH domain-containing protein n=1 Tax=Natronobacillus azotifigens TaxID=472978 RepID=A0A9J6R8Y4_9BACI|nr:PH domain-containing protein [Natronobacillus azotifigens]MCZ0701716.1 PH domain-containing protein [Natronobacillus azotifigens]
MSEPKRLHFLAILFQTLSSIKDWFLGLFPLIFLFGRGNFLLYSLIGFSILAVIMIGYSMIGWYRFTYQLDDDQIRIERGIFIRKKRTISKHRIQSINLSQNIIHRIFGLTSVQIETAGSDADVDAKLTAVTMSDGIELRKHLKPSKQQAMLNVETEDTENAFASDQEDTVTSQIAEKTDNQYDYDYVLENNYPKYETPFKRLFLYGSTSGGFSAIMGIFFLIIFEVENLIPEALYESTTAWLYAQAIWALIALFVVFLVIVWILGVFGMVIKYGDFTIVRYDEELYITRGLWEKKQLTIPLKRIQAVGIKQNLIRQPLGFASLYVESAGGEINKTEGTRTIILPLLHKREIQAFLEKMLPEYQLDWEQLIPAPKRAIPYYLIKSSIVPFLAMIPTAVFALNWLWIPKAFFVLALIIGWIDYRTAGSCITKEQVTLQNWLFSKETVILKHRRIQALEKKQHFLHRRHRLATIKASILNNFMGQHYIVHALDQEQVDQIGDWYSYRK